MAQAARRHDRGRVQAGQPIARLGRTTEIRRLQEEALVITKPDFDVAIIGGGPAGSSMAAYLAKAGVSCVVFERELFPRPHVGESLVPSSTRVFRDLDFLPQMEAAKFPHKYGAVWTTDDKKTPYVHDLEGLAPDFNVDIRFDERQHACVDKNHTYHVDRGKFDHIYIHFLPISNTWIWQIPISDDVTSIGVVTQKKNFAKSREDREKFFWSSVGTRPMIEETLRKANRVRPFKDEGDYSYAMKQLCGDRFLMVGDAGRFVDPIFSTAFSIALNSSRFAHKDILGALEKNDFSRQSFANFENTLRLGTKNWYDFITVYYRLNVLFTYFINDPRYRLDVLKLFQGDVDDDATPPLQDKMRKMVTEVEQNEKHPSHKLLAS